MCKVIYEHFIIKLFIHYLIPPGLFPSILHLTFTVGIILKIVLVQLAKLYILLTCFSSSESIILCIQVYLYVHLQRT